MDLHQSLDWKTMREAAMSLYDKLHLTQREYYHFWKSYVVFSWRWWLALSLIIVPWTLWFFVRKKDSTCRLLFAGFSVMIVSSFLDAIGVTLHYWSYAVTVFPLMPSYIPFDLSAMPVATMLWLQFFPKMKLIWKALIYAFVGGFVFEPLCDWIGLAVQETWQFVYSFLILFAMYLMAYFVSNRVSFEKIKQ